MFTLIIPALFRSQKESIPPLDTPALSRFLQFGRFASLPQSISQLFLQYACSGLTLADDEVYLSPTWQKVGLHSMSLLEGTYIGISKNEAHQLCDELNAFYDGVLHFTPLRPDLWKLRLPHPPCWTAPDIWSVCGHLDGSVQAEGENRKQWLQLTTELQMWLHQHSINTHRKLKNLPLINGVWLWNAPQNFSTSTFALMGSNSVWAKNALPAPHSWQQWQKSCLKNQTSIQDSALFLDDLLLSAYTDDIWHYQETLQTWDKNLFSPMLNSLHQGDLDGIHLICELGSFTLRRHHFWAFWRKKFQFDGKSHVFTA